jgi:PIN domain nuclease of toxin-antitoxin system
MMRLLMDTNVVIRLVSGTLSEDAADMLEDTGNMLYYSAVNIWEIVTKQQLGKLNIPVSAGIIRQHLDERGCRELAITARHALAMATLASVNKDPFDRMLVAQAVTEGLTLITTDSLLAHYTSEVMVVD